jgi:four helix bundle protein
MDRATKVVDIRERAMDYGLRAIKLFQFLNKKADGAAKILARQYLRSATSVGANLVEAQSGESRRDFIHKCSIAQKEARESRYWLLLMLKSELVPPARFSALLDETNQLIAILTSIIVKSKRRPAS